MPVKDLCVYACNAVMIGGWFIETAKTRVRCWLKILKKSDSATVL